MSWVILFRVRNVRAEMLPESYIPPPPATAPKLLGVQVYLHLFERRGTAVRPTSHVAFDLGDATPEPSIDFSLEQSLTVSTSFIMRQTENSPRFATLLSYMQACKEKGRRRRSVGHKGAIWREEDIKTELRIRGRGPKVSVFTIDYASCGFTTQGYLRIPLSSELLGRWTDDDDFVLSIETPCDAVAKDAGEPGFLVRLDANPTTRPACRADVKFSFAGTNKPIKDPIEDSKSASSSQVTTDLEGTGLSEESRLLAALKLARETAAFIQDKAPHLAVALRDAEVVKQLVERHVSDEELAQLALAIIIHLHPAKDRAEECIPHSD